ncbi:MAG: molybdopterin-dependent oxidoreductase [Bacillota bacterium]
MKKILVALLAGLVVLTLAACQTGTPQSTPAATAAATVEATTTATTTSAVWTVTVTGATKTAFTKADYATLKEVTIEATKKKKDGTQTTNEYTGVLISDVLTFLGVTDYTKITLTASDGYSADITKDMLGDKAILATKKDGAALESDSLPIMSVLEGQGGNTWVGAITSITITK